MRYNPFSASISDTGSLVIMSFIIVTIIIDTSLPTISLFSGGISSSSINIVMFIITALIFSFGQYVILGFIRRRSQAIKSPILNIIQKFVFVIQFLLIAIFFIIILQMILTTSYDILLLKALVWITSISSFILLGLLAQKFVSWFKVNPNQVVILYAIAMSILSLNAVFIILYVTSSLYRFGEDEYVRPLRSTVPNVAFLGVSNTSYLGYLITSVLSFILTWIATATLLHYYSGIMGKVKYWILVSIPLVYFLSAFQPFFLDLLTPFRLSDPVLFGIVYTLFFTATKPLGGILFGIAFWNVAKSITRHVVKDYMMISAYGMMLLFASNQITGLILVHYPPFGLASISFLGIASYLVLVGIYSSAISLAEDMNLRRSMRKTLEKESMLLHKIGRSQIEMEIQKKVTTITKDLSDDIKSMEETSGVKPSLEEEDIKEYVKTALEEVKTSRKNLENT